MPAPWVDIELDELRKIRFRHNDIADLEVATGKGLKVLLDDQTGQQFHGIRVLLAFGLRWIDKRITPTRAGELIQEHWIDKGKTLDDLAEVIQEALIVGGIVRADPATTKSAEGNATPNAPSL